MNENKKIIIVTTAISVLTTLGILYFLGLFKNDEEQMVETEYGTDFFSEGETEYGTDFFPEDETEYGTDYPYSGEGGETTDDETGPNEILQLTPEESYQYSIGPIIEYMLAEVEDLRIFSKPLMLVIPIWTN